MRFTSTSIIACAFLAIAAPAFGASDQAHDDCDSDDADRNIAGCTLIVQDPSEGAHMHSIALVGRALAYLSKGDRDRAEADFTYAIELDPNNALAFNDRGTLWRERGDVDRAIADFTRAIAIEALPHSDLPGSGHVNIHANRALAYQVKGDFGRAIADFDEPSSSTRRMSTCASSAPAPSSSTARTSAPCPISMRSSASTRRAPSPASRAAPSAMSATRARARGSRRAISTVRSPTSARRSCSARRAPTSTTRAGLPS